MVHVFGVLAVAGAWSIDVAAAQAGADEAQDRPGWLALLMGSLMLLIWAVGLGLAIHRARKRQMRPAPTKARSGGAEDGPPSSHPA